MGRKTQINGEGTLQDYNWKRKHVENDVDGDSERRGIPKRL